MHLFMMVCELQFGPYASCEYIGCCLCFVIMVICDFLHYNSDMKPHIDTYLIHFKGDSLLPWPYVHST